MIDLLRNRRSHRVFTDKPLSPADVALLEESILRSPSSRGINPWRFFFVTNREVIEKLAESKPGAQFLRSAPLAVVIAADPTKSDVWIEDCSIAATILQLTAESLKLGSCWAQIRNRFYLPDISAESYVLGILGCGEDWAIDCIIGIGYPGERLEGHNAESLGREKIEYLF